jgi:peroxiredoxin
MPEIKKMGVDILFLSGDRPEILYSNLKQETQEFIDGLDYTILSDARLEMGMAYGLAFRVPDDTISRYQSRNWDLDESSMENHKALSVPAVYVIDTNGMIAFAYANPDYRVRLPADEVKEAVEEVINQQPLFELGPPSMDM